MNGQVKKYRAMHSTFGPGEYWSDVTGYTMFQADGSDKPWIVEWHDLTPQPESDKPRNKPKVIRSYADLTFSRKVGDLVEFTSPSAAKKKHAVNTTTLDLTTGEACCDCIHADTHPDEPPRCWHAATIADAWHIHECRRQLAPYRVSDARLRAIASRAIAADDGYLITACGDETLARLVRAEAKRAAMQDLYGDQAAD